MGSILAKRLDSAQLLARRRQLPVFPDLTRRDVRLPGIRGKALAVIGVRRGGKTSFLQQCRSDRLAEGRSPQSQLLVSLEDERLAGMSVADLGWLLDEHARRFPRLAEAGGGAPSLGAG